MLRYVYRAVQAWQNLFAFLAEGEGFRPLDAALVGNGGGHRHAVGGEQDGNPVADARERHRVATGERGEHVAHGIEGAHLRL